MKNTEFVKGFKDYKGKEAEKREEIKEILVGTFKRYGFEPPSALRLTTPGRTRRLK